MWGVRRRAWDLALPVMWVPAGAAGGLWCWAGGQWPPAAVFLEIGAGIGLLFAGLALWVGMRGDEEGAHELASDALRRFLCWLAVTGGYLGIHWVVVR